VIYRIVAPARSGTDGEKSFLACLLGQKIEAQSPVLPRFESCAEGGAQNNKFNSDFFLTVHNDLLAHCDAINTASNKINTSLRQIHNCCIIIFGVQLNSARHLSQLIDDV
jgi:hypothetical protein